MAENNLDALIAKNIGNLEASIRRIEEEIDPRINAAAWDALKSALKNEDFFFEDGDDPDESWFAPRSWIINEDSDPWFELSARDGSQLDTWLACYCEPRNEREAIGIQWYYNNLYVRDYKAILETHKDDLKNIEAAGFRRDGNDIYLPIEFDQNAIAKGFAEGDLRDAMAPISRAVAALGEIMQSFQNLRDAMVAKAG
ncbi:MAG: hypothetical protein K5821_06675 [Nitrobacter sp.]|uniref:hypothetical protein n=1 Tax=Nitrobacter sp. TaxID=29420 RepID=UPI0026392859|nr:hypothetical protein [Nitrobacter sp.]MCV0386102.1 hypothetical protein [Nitrobacter sp.]